MPRCQGSRLRSPGRRPADLGSMTGSDSNRPRRSEPVWHGLARVPSFIERPKQEQKKRRPCSGARASACQWAGYGGNPPLAGAPEPAIPRWEPENRTHRTRDHRLHRRLGAEAGAALVNLEKPWRAIRKVAGSTTCALPQQKTVTHLRKAKKRYIRGMKSYYRPQNILGLSRDSSPNKNFSSFHRAATL